MKDISPILKALGLLDSEIKLYLKALEDGPGTVLDLAKATGLSRQAIYVAIESLTKRGLMSNALRGKKRFYAAEHPDKLLDYAKRRDVEMHERVQDLERMLPELELAAGGEKPVVRVFEGKEGLRAVMADMQNTKTKVSFEIADLDAINKVLTKEDIAALRDSVRKGGTKVRGLYAGQTQGNSNPVDRMFLSREQGGFSSHIGTYGDDKIALVTFEGKMYSVIIESKPLNKALRLLFETAFKNAKK
jgi:sugar-specific transcriptional regulator TrmB